MIPDLTVGEIARFYDKLQPGGCGVVWSGETNRHGYGRFVIYRQGRRIRILAHRLAYKLATGEDPGPSVVRHQCDTPPCCTPGCFLLGTQADNVRDAVERGRIDTIGLRHWRAARDDRAKQRLTTGQKRCSHCKTVKAFGEFHQSRRSIDGRSYWCKACHASNARGMSERERRRLGRAL